MLTRRALLGTTIAAGATATFAIRTARSEDFKLRWGHSMPAAMPVRGHSVALFGTSHAENSSLPPLLR
jgi:hypothetical protein